jgi:hypothetical protein
MLALLAILLTQKPLTLEEVQRRMVALERLKVSTARAAEADRCDELSDPAPEPELFPGDLIAARAKCAVARIARANASVPINQRCEVIRDQATQRGFDDAHGYTTEVLAACLAERVRSLEGRCELIARFAPTFSLVSYQSYPSYRAALKGCHEQAWRAYVVPLLTSGKCEDGIDLAHDIDPFMQLWAVDACDQHAAWLTGGRAPEWADRPAESKLGFDLDCAQIAQREARWRFRRRSSTR